MMGGTAPMFTRFLHRHGSRQAFKIIAEENDMVYFGRVDQQADEHKLVRGVTLSPTHRDDHYCIGSVAGRGTVLLQRTDTIVHPSHPPQRHTWFVAAFDLRPPDLPHIVIDAGGISKAFYDQLLIKNPYFITVGKEIFEDYDTAFSDHFTVYAAPDSIDDLHRVLTPDTAAILAHHFSELSFELYDDMLIVYATLPSEPKRLLDKMIHAGCWLSDQLDGQERRG